MKGVILAGGTGSRLRPITKVTNKHLLPVHDKPMIYYPLSTLISAGVTDIMLVVGNESAGDFLKLLSSGSEFGAKFTYRVQDESGGIAQALMLAADFVGGDDVVVILGDNIIEDNISESVKEFSKAGCEAMLFVKKVPDPERFGVAEIDSGRIVSIEEKPKSPKSNYAVTGLYMYNSEVFGIIKGLKPSARGEYEITDVNNEYIRRGRLLYKELKGYWTDAGTFPSLFRASALVREKEEKAARAEK
jgi:glucose-1-phosphate thymidylyltransferase